MNLQLWFAPSGAGKTTFLNMLGGLDEPTNGTIEINGIRIDNLSASEKTKVQVK